MTTRRAVEFKLYLDNAQEAALERYLRVCCWLYNQALEQRIKSYQRRKESTSYYDQQAWLTLRQQDRRNVKSECCLAT